MAMSVQFAHWFYLVCAFSVSCIFLAAEFRFFIVFRIFLLIGFQHYCVTTDSFV